MRNFLRIVISVLWVAPAWAGDWKLNQEVSTDGYGFRTGFGSACAWRGDHFLVGASHEQVGPERIGVAHIYYFAVGQYNDWRFWAPDGVVGDEFGFSVALDGDTYVVGAPNHARAGIDAGAVYVFTWSPGNLANLQQELIPADAESGERFGCSIAIEGDVLLIGARGASPHGGSSGAAYVFTRSGSHWTQQAKLVPQDAAADDLAGHSVALSGDTAIVSAPGKDVGEVDAGAAYAFTRIGATWSQSWTFTRTDSRRGDAFGSAVAILGDTVAIATPYAGVTSDTGLVSVYTRKAASWSLQRELVPSDSSRGERFGSSIALAPDLLVVGAPYHIPAGGDHHQGIAFVYRRLAGAWDLQERLEAPWEPWFDGLFGSSVAIDDCHILIGGPGRAYLPYLPPSGTATVFNCWTPTEFVCSGDSPDTPCPCRRGTWVGGCPNSISSAGAFLFGAGLTSITNDSFYMDADDIPARFAVFMQGGTPPPGGSGSPFGDGVLCLTGPIVRLGIVTRIGGGGGTWMLPPFGGTETISRLGGITTPGTRCYQVWYRDSAAFCSSARFNLTNALAVRWIP